MKHKMKDFSTQSCIWLLLASGVACSSAPHAEDADAGAPMLSEVVRIWGTRQNLDLLFIFKNSVCGLDDRIQWQAHIAPLLDDLETAVTGRPDLHIGVASTDMGTEIAFEIEQCDAEGDAGRLQSIARVGDCSPPSASYIDDGFDGESSRVNYDGTLSEVFTCISSLSNNSCGFIQPFKAVRAALEPSHPDNVGFVRENAHLAVIIVSDKDDCSASDPALYDPDNAAVGAFGSFRCFEHGITCDQGDLRSPGLKTGCRSDESAQYMEPVSLTREFMKQAKRPPYRAMVVAMSGQDAIGSVSSVLVAENTAGTAYIDPACSRENEGGVHPGIRLHALAEGLGPHGHYESLCNDFSVSVPAVGQFIRDNLASTCIQGALSDADPVAVGIQPRCEVVEIGGGQELAMPSCNDSLSRPCWRLEEDAACKGLASGLSLVVEGELSVQGSDVVARCETLRREQFLLLQNEEWDPDFSQEAAQSQPSPRPIHRLVDLPYQCPVNPF